MAIKIVIVEEERRNGEKEGKKAVGKEDGHIPWQHWAFGEHSSHRLPC